MAPVQEANSDNLRDTFQFSTYVTACINEAILMSTHNIQFHDKIRKFP